MNKEEIGYRIKAIRNKKGISQEKLALDSGLDRTYINSVENGKRNITIDSLNKITYALDISLKDFFDNEYIIDFDPSSIVFLISSDITNYNNTMKNGVDLDSLKSIFSYDDFTNIAKLTKNKKIHIWGTTESNERIFNLLLIGNIGIFSNAGKVFAYSKLLYKCKNYEFGKKYWTNKKNKNWPLILIMEKPTEINVPVSKLMSEANYKKKFIQGLTIPRGEHNFLIKNFIDKCK